MSENIALTTPLIAWRGDGATYHLVMISPRQAEPIAAHALMQRLEFGKRRGFGSVKVFAQIGETRWKTSVFPQKVPADREGTGGKTQQEKQWMLLVSKKVMRAEDLAEGDPVSLELELL
jgi:hypothetical protein